MSHRIRRDSMEHLELYDIDKLTKSSLNHPLSSPCRNSMERLALYDSNKLTISLSKHHHHHQLPPPLPPPRKERHLLPTSNNFECYQFLCDTERSKKDPIYAATPMFTVIPQSSHEKHPRRILGARIPSEMITPISATSPSSAEPKSAGTVKDTEEEEEEEEKSDEYDNRQESDDDDENDDKNESGSNSSNDNDNGDDDILGGDDNDRKGIVEQIFNRDKKE